MDVHVYIHSDSDKKLDRLIELIHAFKQEMEIKMSAVTDSVDALATAVAAEDSLIDSAVALINGIPALIAAAAAGSTDPATVQKLNDLQAAIKGKSDALAAALTANTPVTPAQAAAT